MSDDKTGEPPAGPGRRAVLCGAGLLGVAGAAAACGGGPREVEPSADLKGREVAKVADVPVGGGTVVPEHKVVVTQPTAGTFKVFDARCTHAGCPVDRIRRDAIYCPCHGSEFRIADGTVAKGPASRALLEYPAQVKGDGVVVV
ncbi:Rieske (2Fe-2S) protein [Thermomonospora cellulosilytica]|uniref:Cytochrome bc1 complex Rieske iron-sulfur subunit n=1 Tax=Thermomonospora cellulosilytica TaxID=1411118 RepID=A0A7W3RBE7_9ACTN|nr:Rieske (2Fe-2S) protein [Thermomonospora cellulosilytica]MBA9006195.1 Rieske Fe-S protein [Thermomonospora cellulosilytica]